MSGYIPFEIQSEIMKRLPVKSLVQFRSVSKQWKSFIDNPEFIKTYHINHSNPQHNLLVAYKINHVQTYTLIIDDNTFPKQKFPLTTAPVSHNFRRHTSILGSVNGLFCYFERAETNIVVIWNPSVRKYVRIAIPNVLYLLDGCTVIGFGVCSDTSDPKLVRINFVKTPCICWEVQVFTLSSRVWRTVYTGAPFNTCGLTSNQVFIDGSIYWSGRLSNCVVAFDLKSEKFAEVCLPERLVRANDLCVTKVNESLGLLEYNKEDGMSVCGVGMRKNGVDKPFTKIYTVKVEGKSWRVLGFRNNGEVVVETGDDDCAKSQIGVYERSSGRINNVGIKGGYITFSTSSYMETLLLLDESNSIIH